MKISGFANKTIFEVKNLWVKKAVWSWKNFRGWKFDGVFGPKKNLKMLMVDFSRKKTGCKRWIQNKANMIFRKTDVFF